MGPHAGTGGGLRGRPAPGGEVKDTFLFADKGDACFAWDGEAKEYRLDPSASDAISAKVTASIGFLDAHEFRDRYRGRIEKLAASGTREQKLWTKAFSKWLEESEKRRSDAKDGDGPR